MKIWKVLAVLLALAAIGGAVAYFIFKLVPELDCPAKRFFKQEKPQTDPFVQEHI